jgi:hypothetical protein
MLDRVVLMPQITVTLDDDVYMDLVHNLPKGLKSKFVNRAIKKAIQVTCAGMGNAMHDYARKGEHAAHEKVNEMLSLRRENRIEMQELYGDEEE